MKREVEYFYKNLLERSINAGKGAAECSCQHRRGPDLHYGAGADRGTDWLSVGFVLVRRLCQMFGFGGQALKSGAGRLLHCALAPMPRAKLLFHQGKGPGALSIPGPPTSVVAPQEVGLLQGSDATG